MKKHIYFLEFIDGTIIVENNRTCLKNQIYGWCKKNGDYYLTEHQLDGLIYNRSKTKPKYIKYFGKSTFNDLFDDKDIKTTHTNNKPFTPNYILALKRKALKTQYDNLKENPNRLDRNQLTTIISC